MKRTYSLTTQYGFLIILSRFLSFDQTDQIEYVGGNGALRLEEFLGTQIAISNNAWLGLSADDMGNILSLVVPSFRVVSCQIRSDLQLVI